MQREINGTRRADKNTKGNCVFKWEDLYSRAEVLAAAKPGWELQV